MSSIYIHIPFCKKRCSYCNFYSTVKFEHLNNYVETLCSEIIERQDFLSNKNIRTLYFGGGTPSVLSAIQINKIYSVLCSVFNMDNLEEFSLECNPDDMNSYYIESLQSTKVNRISVGIQSLDDKVLSFINRRHNAKAAKDCVKNLLTSGYENVSIDLIYGIPGQTLESWKQSVDEAIALGIKHISSYNLSFEEGTAMYKYLSNAPDEDLCFSMYNYLCDTLKQNEFEHYEISNFAKDGFRSKHNTVYWQGGEYLGIGSGAHSYNGRQRFENKEYKVKNDGRIIWEQKIEVLTEQEKYNELIITALRTKEGINFIKVPYKYQKHFMSQSEPYLEKRLLKRNGNFISLTENGIFISDYIMRDLIL